MSTTKIKFATSGSSVHVFKLNEDTILNKLKPQIYTLKFNELSGFYLGIDKDKLKLPAKIYGDTDNRTQKCLQSYRERSTSTGILLTGDKGTGKTLQMALLANKAVSELNLPVILIKQAYEGSQFISFLEDIGESCLIFDEFGKMYNSSSRRNDENDIPQKSLLSLMDGVDKTKRLIIMTENDEFDINSFMLNRPSRIYYHFRYTKLKETSIQDFCKDKNIQTDIISDILDFSRKASIFSFDMLQSIVEEHSRFNTPIKEVVEDLNIDTSEADIPKLEIVKLMETATETEREFTTPKIIPDPDYDNVQIEIKKIGASDKDPRHKQFDYICIDNSDLVYETGNQRIYETNDFTIITKTIPPKQSNYQRFL